ncbi:MAG: tetratricopeptide repeat protein [Deltaproteobacteria bacterium]|nr:tetratricopeptide repeat protein [Deltaproteobacteria bacterium]MBW2394355.1 tetratricopeptide repeat protein [Deltaproteobacteria bacterium]
MDPNSPVPAVFDVGDDSFVTDVLEASHQVPIVVDFWAPWCGPCKALGPILERLAEESGGAFRLAKLNVDEAPQVAAQVQARSIPLVVGFRDGQAVAEFVGARPESGVREFLAKLLPSEADQLASEGADLLTGGQPEAAEQRFRAALDAQDRHPRALLGLARVLASRGEAEAALAELDQLTLAGPEIEQEAEHLAAEIRTQSQASASGDADTAALQAKLDADPDDLATRLELGRALAAAHAYEPALEAFLQVIQRDRDFADQAARKAMLDLFELLGNDHDLTHDYRAALARTLFR